MNIFAEKNKLLRIYDEKCLFSRTFMNEKIHVYFLPSIFIIISCSSFAYGCFSILVCGECIISNLILIISSIFIVLSFYFNEKMYEKFIMKYYNSKKDRYQESHYHIFIRKLKVNKIIKKEEIKYYIELLKLDSEPTVNNNETFFLKYLSWLYIPMLMIYFHEIISEAQTIAFFSFGLFFVPLFVFVFRNIFNRKRNKLDIILRYLKRRYIELEYGK